MEMTQFVVKGSKAFIQMEIATVAHTMLFLIEN